MCFRFLPVSESHRKLNMRWSCRECRQRAFKEPTQKKKQLLLRTVGNSGRVIHCQQKSLPHIASGSNSWVELCTSRLPEDYWSLFFADITEILRWRFFILFCIVVIYNCAISSQNERTNKNLGWSHSRHLQMCSLWESFVKCALDVAKWRGSTQYITPSGQLAKKKKNMF